jgi:hypothetical protein
MLSKIKKIILSPINLIITNKLCKKIKIPSTPSLLIFLWKQQNIGLGLNWGFSKKKKERKVNYIAPDNANKNKEMMNSNSE